METHRKFDVACAQLERAMRLFGEGDYYSAATLAGASEEIFGALLRRRGEENAFEIGREQITRVAEILGSKSNLASAGKTMNRFRNWLKHIEDEYEEEEAEFDAEFEAANLIERAIDNHLALTGKETVSMVKFVTSRVDINNAHIRMRL